MREKSVNSKIGYLGIGKYRVLICFCILTLLLAGFAVGALTPYDDDEENFYTDEITLFIGENVTLRGKILTLLSFSGPAVNVDVDGISERVEQGSWTYIDGLFVDLIVQLEANEFRNASAILNYTQAFSCGNGICERNEGPEVCCTDCGCLDPQLCSSNSCVAPGYDTCAVVSDCDDGDICTFDICSGVPKVCSYIDKTKCKNGDFCCPTGCTEHNDNDCQPPPECVADVDCDDGNELTEGKCSALTNKCSYAEIILNLETDCVNSADCHSEGLTACDSAVCNSTNQCATTRSDGCIFNNSCIPVGVEHEGAVCKAGNIFETLPKQPQTQGKSLPLFIIVLELLGIVYILFWRKW